MVRCPSGMGAFVAYTDGNHLRQSRIQMQVQEGMEHNAVLRSLGSEQWVTERLDSMQHRLRGNVVKRLRFTVAARLIMGCVFGLGYLLAFVWGGIGLRNGTITCDDFVSAACRHDSAPYTATIEYGSWPDTCHSEH